MPLLYMVPGSFGRVDGPEEPKKPRKKRKTMDIISIVFGSVVLSALLLSVFYPDKGIHYHSSYNIKSVEVPEEINTISRDSANPSSLDAWICHGVLHLRIPTQEQADTLSVIQHISYIKN